MSIQRIAAFEKVSLGQYIEGWKNSVAKKYKKSEEEIESIYNKIKLPLRATVGSAGYDFFSPILFELKPGETITIPTGIRAKMADGWVLQCYPRSGHGFNFKLQLNNTVAIIDSDYYYAKNEGHIFLKMTNDSREDKTLVIEETMAFMQGLFMQYGITFDDEASEKRISGLGSTTKKPRS